MIAYTYRIGAAGVAGKRQLMALLTAAVRSDVEDLAQHVERPSP